MVLSIKESREFVIFQSFAHNESYDRALEVIEAHDQAHPNGKILASGEDKLFMFESYKLFKEAERPLCGKDGLKPDYDNPQIMERFKNILSQKMPATAREVVSEKTGSAVMNKANVGRMLAMYAKQVKSFGRGALAEQKRLAEKEHRRRVAVTGKSGWVGYGGYGDGDVFKNDSVVYKTNAQVVQDKIREER